nr:ATP-binding protein [Fervidicella metallireducens]
MNCIYVCGDNLKEYEKCFLTESSTRYKDKAIEEIEYLLAVERMQKDKNKDSVAQAKTKLIAEIEDIVKQADEDYKRETSTAESNRQRVKNIRGNRKIEKTARRAEEAQYKEQVIPDYQDNSFIEALPNLLSPHKVVEKLAFYPQYHQNERKLDSHYRIYMVDRLFQVFQPLPMNIELERKISRTMRQGYVFRNPFESKLAQGFCRDYYGMNPVNSKDDDVFYPSSFGFTLIGISGLGKTSSLKRILNMYPQVIVHSEYRGIPFSAYQVVWVKLECPHDGSIKGLLYEFFSEINRLLGTNYYQKMIRTRATADAMMTVMNQVVRNCSLGILIIDEIQHLSMAKSGGSEKMLNFFVNLVNNVGVPVILEGTPKAVKVLQGDFRQAQEGQVLVVIWYLTGFKKMRCGIY